jgi:hypothetical protein
MFSIPGHFGWPLSAVFWEHKVEGREVVQKEKEALKIPGFQEIVLRVLLSCSYPSN